MGILQNSCGSRGRVLLSRFESPRLPREGEEGENRPRSVGGGRGKTLQDGSRKIEGNLPRRKKGGKLAQRGGGEIAMRTIASIRTVESRGSVLIKRVMGRIGNKERWMGKKKERNRGSRLRPP